MSSESGQPGAAVGPGCTRGLVVVLAGFIGIVILFGFLIASVGGSDVKPWLDEHYTHVSGSDPEDETVAYRSDDDARTTAAGIVEGTDPDDRFETGSTTQGSSGPVFLRYDADRIVVVKPADGDTSRIELEEFDRAYNRHSAILPVFWGGYFGRSGGFGGGGGGFRGGGGGFGK